MEEAVLFTGIVFRLYFRNKRLKWTPICLENGYAHWMMFYCHYPMVLKNIFLVGLKNIFHTITNAIAEKDNWNYWRESSIPTQPIIMETIVIK